MKVIHCRQCKKEIKGGFYNTPNGVYCPDCWEKKPQEVRDKALADTLKKLAIIGRNFNK